MLIKAQFSSCEWCCHSIIISYRLPLIMYSNPLQSCSVPHASLASGASTTRMYLPKQRCQVSPILIGIMPVYFSIPIRRHSIESWYAAQRGQEFTIHFVNEATICRSSSLASPYQRIQCCRLNASVPSGPSLPEICQPTSITVYYLISRGTINVGAPTYLLNLRSVSGCSSLCSAWRTSRTISLLL